MVNVLLDDRQGISVDRKRIVAAGEQAAEAEGATGEISVSLVDAAQMADLNQRYTGQSGPTDVLSFPIDGLVRPNEGRQTDDLRNTAESPAMVGEVVICVEVAAAQAKTTLEDELDLLVVHGVLHLLGYDHHTQLQAEAMAARELSLVGRSGATWLLDEDITH